MTDENDGVKAIEQLNDSNFMGNIILVKKSKPHPQEKRSINQRPVSRYRDNNRDLRTQQKVKKTIIVTTNFF